MNISAVQTGAVYSFKAAFAGNKKPQKNENPVSAAGEKAVLARAAFITGLGIGVRLLCELMDGDFIYENFGKTADKIVSKQKNLSSVQRFIKTGGVFAGLCALFIGGAALLYTVFNAPKINYEGNINTFKNKKDMDIYIKGNEAEKELYSQMNAKAQTADEPGKAKLRTQYMMMKSAKNQVPDFVNRRK